MRGWRDALNLDQLRYIFPDREETDTFEDFFGLDEETRDLLLEHDQYQPFLLSITGRSLNLDRRNFDFILHHLTGNRQKYDFYDWSYYFASADMDLPELKSLTLLSLTYLNDQDPYIRRYIFDLVQLFFNKTEDPDTKSCITNRMLSKCSWKSDACEVGYRSISICSLLNDQIGRKNLTRFFAQDILRDQKRFIKRTIFFHVGILEELLKSKCINAHQLLTILQSQSVCLGSYHRLRMLSLITENIQEKCPVVRDQIRNEIDQLSPLIHVWQTKLGLGLLERVPLDEASMRSVLNSLKMVDFQATNDVTLYNALFHFLLERRFDEELVVRSLFGCLCLNEDSIDANVLLKITHKIFHDSPVVSQLAEKILNSKFSFSELVIP